MKPMELIEQGRFLGEEFLLWLWQRGLLDGGTSGVEGDSSALFLDDAVVLVSEQGDVREISLRKGNPTESREAFKALSRGMRPSKAKVRLLSGDLEWTFSLNAATFDVSALKLPPARRRTRPAASPTASSCWRAFRTWSAASRLPGAARGGCRGPGRGLQGLDLRGLAGETGDEPWEG